jgi:hypothetical protein
MDPTGCQAVESPSAGAGAAVRGSDRPSRGGIPAGRCGVRAAGIRPALTRWNPRRPVRRPDPTGIPAVESPPAGAGAAVR